MKTVLIGNAQPELRKLVEEAFAGAPVVLACGDKRVKLERYAPASGAVDFDLAEDSAELEAELLQAVRGSFTPFEPRDFEVIANRTITRGLHPH